MPALSSLGYPSFVLRKEYIEKMQPNPNIKQLSYFAESAADIDVLVAKCPQLTHLKICAEKRKIDVKKLSVAGFSVSEEFVEEISKCRELRSLEIKYAKVVWIDS